MSEDHVELYHEIHGEAGPWITLVHGGLVPSPSWDRQVRDLSPNLTDVARVLTLDLRGYGQSPPAPHGQGYDIATLAEDVRALWDALGIERTTLVGFSMGGFVAQQLALEHPGRVAALVLVSTATRLSSNAVAAFTARATEIEEYGLTHERDHHLANAFSAGFRERQPELLDDYARHIAANRPGVVVSTFRVLGDFDRHDELTAVGCPTLVACGEQDPGLGPDSARELADALETDDLIVFPEVGHTLQIENANSFNRQVLDFLARHEVIR